MIAVSLPWTAGSVRARLLADRCVGPRGAEAIAAAGSLEAGLGILAGTPYGRTVRPGMDLAAAQHAVAATLLWHLRVLAGWLPRGGAEVIRVLAGWFEIRNIEDRLALLAGSPRPPPYALGSLAGAWRLVAPAPTAAAVRAALAGSVWGDPATDDPAGIHLALRLAWAERVRRRVPEAARWAKGAVELLVLREQEAGRSDRPSTARSRGLGDLWEAEEGWWRGLESDAASMLARPGHDRGVVVASVALLAADARRVRGALVTAVSDGRS